MNRPSPANLKRFAAALHIKCDVMRGRVYDDVRDVLGLPLGDVSDLRVVATGREKDMLMFADALYRAQVALIEAQLFLGEKNENSRARP